MHHSPSKGMRGEGANFRALAINRASNILRVISRGVEERREESLSYCQGRATSWTSIGGVSEREWERTDFARYRASQDRVAIRATCYHDHCARLRISVIGKHTVVAWFSRCINFVFDKESCVKSPSIEYWFVFLRRAFIGRKYR